MKSGCDQHGPNTSIYITLWVLTSALGRSRFQLHFVSDEEIEGQEERTSSRSHDCCMGGFQPKCHKIHSKKRNPRVFLPRIVELEICIYVLTGDPGKFSLFRPLSSVDPPHAPDLPSQSVWGLKIMFWSVWIWWLQILQSRVFCSKAEGVWLLRQAHYGTMLPVTPPRPFQLLPALVPPMWKPQEQAHRLQNTWERLWAAG